MVTIVLLVSRIEFLDRVITSIELLHCDRDRTNVLCLVDGDDDLYLHTRNLINGTKFRERLVIRSALEEMPTRLDIPKRRAHICALHNQARKYISKDTDYVFSIEDDTTFNNDALLKLLRVANQHSAIGFVEGVEMGRWGVPYVGAWNADDVYDPTLIISVRNMYNKEIAPPPSRIDAGGLYCALIRGDLYRNHEFNSDNGLGPDINFGIEARQKGYENFIAWDVPCNHFSSTIKGETVITPEVEGKIVTLVKKNESKWITTY